MKVYEKAKSAITGRNSKEIPIYLNVYDLDPKNESLLPFGLGLFHSGVQIEGKEYTFAAESGIFNHPPRQVPSHARFRDSIFMGMFNGKQSQIDDALNELRHDFKGNNYHILSKNCNCFANAFILKLINREIPGWVNRMANIGDCCSCMIPSSLLSPQQAEQDSAPLVEKKTSAFSAGKKGYKLTG